MDKHFIHEERDMSLTKMLVFMVTCTVVLQIMRHVHGVLNLYPAS